MNTDKWFQLLLVDETKFRDKVVEVFVTCVHMRLLSSTDISLSKRPNI